MSMLNNVKWNSNNTSHQASNTRTITKTVNGRSNYTTAAAQQWVGSWDFEEEEEEEERKMINRNRNRWESPSAEPSGPILTEHPAVITQNNGRFSLWITSVYSTFCEVQLKPELYLMLNFTVLPTRLLLLLLLLPVAIAVLRLHFRLWIPALDLFVLGYYLCVPLSANTYYLYSSAILRLNEYYQTETALKWHVWSEGRPCSRYKV